MKEACWADIPAVKRDSQADADRQASSSNMICLPVALVLLRSSELTEQSTASVSQGPDLELWALGMKMLWMASRSH